MSMLSLYSLHILGHMKTSFVKFVHNKTGEEAGEKIHDHVRDAPITLEELQRIRVF